MLRAFFLPPFAIVFAVVAFAPTWAWATFPDAPVSALEQLKANVDEPVRILVAGVGAQGAEAASALRRTLAGKEGVALVMGSEALGDLSGLDDQEVFRRARRMPVNLVAVVRLYPQGEGRPPMAVAPVYNRDGKSVVTLSFELPKSGGVAAPAPPKAKPLARPETDGLGAPSEPAAPPSSEPPASEKKVEQRFSVLVIDPVDTDIDPDVRVAVSGKMAAELSTVRRFDVLTAADIRAMTALEASRQLAGCDEESCMAEIADALGADLVVSWDISRIGSKRIITVRFFDARQSKNLGRAQAETDVDEELAVKAAGALRETIDAFLRSTLDASIARQEEYEANLLSVEPKGLFGTGREYSRGVDRVPVEMAEFYRAAGMQSEAEDIENFDALATLSMAAGGIIATVGMLTFFGGIVLLGVVHSIPLLGVAAAAIGSAEILLGVLFVVFSAIVRPEPRPIEEERAIAKKHNRRLRRKLGLPEGVSFLWPNAPLVATTALAFDVE